MSSKTFQKLVFMNTNVIQVNIYVLVFEVTRFVHNLILLNDFAGLYEI